MFTLRLFLLVLLATVATAKLTDLCSANVCKSCSKIVMMKAGTRRVQLTCLKLLTITGCCSSHTARSAHQF